MGGGDEKGESRGEELKSAAKRRRATSMDVRREERVLEEIGVERGRRPATNTPSGARILGRANENTSSKCSEKTTGEGGTTDLFERVVGCARERRCQNTPTAARNLLSSGARDPSLVTRARRRTRERIVGPHYSERSENTHIGSRNDPASSDRRSASYDAREDPRPTNSFRVKRVRLLSECEMITIPCPRDVGRRVSDTAYRALGRTSMSQQSERRWIPCAPGCTNVLSVIRLRGGFEQNHS